MNHTGYIPPSLRNQQQHDANEAAIKLMPRFAIAPVSLNKGEKLCLFDFWKRKEVVDEVGFVFTRMHQKSGSCVLAGGFNGLFSTIAASRFSNDPIVAFLPFCFHNYAMSRHYFGQDGEGEGSFGSTFARSLREDGIIDWPNGNDPDGLPDYTQPDGIVVGASVEIKWSSIRNVNVPKIVSKAKRNLVGSAAELKDVGQIKTALLNGYGVTFACNNFIGNASIRGSGADACLVGYWDTYGPHQQSLHAVWEHPDLGTLYWAQNSWPASVYPKDPAGGPDCGCWVTEAKVAQALRLDAEVYALSNVSWFPARPEIKDWWKP